MAAARTLPGDGDSTRNDRELCNERRQTNDWLPRLSAFLSEAVMVVEDDPLRRRRMEGCTAPACTSASDGSSIHSTTRCPMERKQQMTGCLA
tara:strand:+ start:127 stop:402 length:276 start_codon:yes stop_codon:yes gene_type:complete